MPRAQTNKLYRTFVKGLITEAGFLTYPEDASTDELNTVLHKAGNRTRRLGMDYEHGSVQRIMGDFYNDTAVTTEYLWKAVANEASINFVVVQLGGDIVFFNADANPFSSDMKTFRINLSAYKAPMATPEQVQSANVEMISGKGFLFIVQEYIDPIVVEYHKTTDTITVTRIIIQVRDFDGVNDNLPNDAEPTTLSAQHYYNLRNQGWVAPGSYVSTGGEGTPTQTYTPPPPPPTSTEQEYYDPYTGEEATYKLGPDEKLP